MAYLLAALGVIHQSFNLVLPIVETCFREFGAMATIEERKNDNGETSYRVKVRLRGHPVATATFKRKTDAKQWAQDTESQIRKGQYFKTSESKRHTLRELLQRYSDEHLANSSKGKRHIAEQRRQLDWLSSDIGDYMLFDLTSSLIIASRARLLKRVVRGKPLTKATANRYMATLSHALSIGVREFEWLDDNPMRKIKKLDEPRGRVRFLSKDERTQLLTAAKADASLYLIIVLAISTGARKGELLSLTWDAVDLERGLMTFHETKNGERRTVPLQGHALELMKEHKAKSTSRYVFRARTADKPMLVDKPFQQLVQKVGLQDFRFHDLRHSAASELAMNGASLGEIAAVLGHKTLAMVQRYAHHSEQHTSEVVASMNARIFNHG